MEHEFPLGKFRPGGLPFLDVPAFLSEIFHWNDPKTRVPFTFKPDFSVNTVD